jgi:ABC-type bacteriocin/lantibiotic exporter with double-glycine peptidase domain
MRDSLSYIASTIIGITAVVILIHGAVTDNFDNVTIGMFLAVITIIIATATAIKNQVLKELRK